MKNFDAFALIDTYCKIATLKEKEANNKFGIAKSMTLSNTVATQVFGAQQIAWLLWSEGNIKVSIARVNMMLFCSPIYSFYLPSVLRAVKDEFHKNCTIEAKFAHMCNDLEDLFQVSDISVFTQSVKFIKSRYPDVIIDGKVSMDKYSQLCRELKNWLYIVDTGRIAAKLIKLIDEKYAEFSIGIDELKMVIARYCILSELKDKTRQGFNYWNVAVPRREVVSEHVFGTQPLAWLVYLEAGSGIDIDRVVAMMSLHETEESIMQDFTPYDPVTAEELIIMGKMAVEVVFGGLKKYGKFVKLLDEFNEKSTKAGKFAYFCDKLECLFRIKMYSDSKLCSIENGCDIVKNDSEVKENIEKGAKSVADLFIMHEMPKFVGTIFEDIAVNLKKFDTSE